MNDEWKYIAGALVGFMLGIVMAVLVVMFVGV